MSAIEITSGCSIRHPVDESLVKPKTLTQKARNARYEVHKTRKVVRNK